MPVAVENRGAVPHRRTAAALAALALAAAGALLSGCTSTPGSTASTHADNASTSPDTLSADPLTAVRSAPDITGHAGSLLDATSLTTSSATKQMTLHGTGSYNYSTRVGQLVVTVPPGSGGTTGKLTEVVTPGVVYMQGSGAKVPAGKWIKVLVQQLGDGNLVSSGATDPASASDALRGVQTAKLAGTETQDGTVLTHYTGTLDLAKAATETGGSQGTGLSVGARTFTVKAVPYEVWLDPTGRIRKLTETFTFSEVPGSSKAKDQVKVVSTSEFSGFGTTVKVAVPSGSEVYTAGQPTPSK